MKKAILLLITLIFILSSCQATPEQPVVIQKDNFEELIENTPQATQASQPPNAPEQDDVHITWEFKDQITKDTGLCEITLNTSITVDTYVDLSPKTASVFTVYPYSFTMDFIENAANSFFTDEYYNGIRTEDDYMMKIMPMENMLPYINERTSQPAAYELNEWKKRFNEAPKINEEAEFKFDKGNHNMVCLKGYPYQGALSELYFQNDGMSNTLFYYYVDDINKYYSETMHEYIGEGAIGMTTTYEGAKQVASDMVYKVYGQDMAHVQTTLASMGKLDENWHPNISFSLGREDFGKKEQCYVFYFTRTYNGIPQLYAPEASNSDDMESEEGGYIYERKWDYKYSMKWPAEYVMVMVDDTGIVEFWGFSPTKIANIVNENVAMLSFEEIFERFKQCIYYTSVWADPYDEELRINIAEIKFGMIRVPIKDNPSQYYMIPAWQFIGNKYTYMDLVTNADGSRGRTEKESGKTFLVLNAIDGSIVDINYYESKRAPALKLLGIQQWANHLDRINPPPNN